MELNDGAMRRLFADAVTNDSNDGGVASLTTGLVAASGLVFTDAATAARAARVVNGFRGSETIFGLIGDENKTANYVLYRHVRSLAGGGGALSDASGATERQLFASGTVTAGTTTGAAGAALDATYKLADTITMTLSALAEALVEAYDLGTPKIVSPESNGVARLIVPDYAPGTWAWELLLDLDGDSGTAADGVNAAAIGTR